MAIKKKKRAVPSRKKPAKKTIKRAPARKKAVKKTAARRPAKTAKKAVSAKKKIKGNVIGIITHYFPKVSAAVVKLKAPLSIGDTIKVKGHTTDFTQRVSSMQIDRVPITQAKKGQEIGLQVVFRVRGNDAVCKA